MDELTLNYIEQIFHSADENGFMPPKRIVVLQSIRPYPTDKMSSTQATDTIEKKVRFTVTVTQYCDYDYEFFCDDCYEYFDIDDEDVINDLWKRLLLRKKPIHLGKMEDEEAEADPFRSLICAVLEEMNKK
jgi:hypothetical protein